MARGLSEETLFWIRVAAFTALTEQVLTSGASLADAEELLLGWPVPGDLPACYACLGGGAGNRRTSESM